MLYPLLKTIADKHGLYLDHKHLRPARGKKRKVCWEDDKGNCHDLDYVLEYGGSEDQIGTPKAFIETAWRRYTKHSRNKAQEMQPSFPLLRNTAKNIRFSEYCSPAFSRRGRYSNSALTGSASCIFPTTASYPHSPKSELTPPLTKKDSRFRSSAKSRCVPGIVGATEAENNRRRLPSPTSRILHPF